LSNIFSLNIYFSAIASRGCFWRVKFPAEVISLYDCNEIRMNYNGRFKKTAQELFRSWKLCSYKIFTDGSVGDDHSAFNFTFFRHLKAVGPTGE
jgi:hypothetical protein